MTPAQVRVGELLAGRYRLGEPLGRGGAATVFAARDETLDREVAVKVWHDPSTGAAESRLTARLHHPGVVVVHDVHSDGATAFLVMERIEGVSLDTELGLGPLSERRTVDVVSQLASTLSLVHTDGVVHGDVKPGNVLLGPGDRVTLTDFGVAGPTATRHRDVAHGTPQYLSPEQVKGEPITPATDVYALGLVLLECLTAERAFPGSPQTAAMARLRRAPVVPGWVAPDLTQLVRDMTDLDPVRRPGAAAVAARLQRHAPGHAETTVLALPGPATQPMAVEAKPWWALVGAALLAVVLGLAVTGPKDPSSSVGDSPAPAPSRTTARPSPTPHVVTPVKQPATTPAPRGKGHKRHGHRDG